MNEKTEKDLFILLNENQMRQYLKWSQLSCFIEQVPLFLFLTKNNTFLKEIHVAVNVLELYILKWKIPYSLSYSTVCSVCSNYTHEIAQWDHTPLVRLSLLLISTEACVYERNDEGVFMWDVDDRLSECKHDEWYTPVCSVRRSRSFSICLLARFSYVHWVSAVLYAFSYSVRRKLSFFSLFFPPSSFTIQGRSAWLCMILPIACKQNTSHHNHSFQGKTIVPPVIASGQASKIQLGRETEKRCPLYDIVYSWMLLFKGFCFHYCSTD